jgi:outer membrane receptor protein involved in Fe transport
MTRIPRDELPDNFEPSFTTAVHTGLPKPKNSHHMKRSLTPATPHGTSRHRSIIPICILALIAPGASRSSLLAQATTRPAAPNAPTAEAEAKDVIKLSIFEVKGDADEGYRATQTLSGSRTATLLRDTPSSISVLNRTFMEDLIVTDISELSMFNISGEVGNNNESPISSGGGGTVSRGTSSTNLRDGVVFYVSLDSHNIDRVELLRGPNGFLYTGGGAGGISNQVTKQGLRKNSQSFALITGSKDLYRGEFDINRMLNDKLAVRASLAYQRGGGFHNHTERSFRGMFFSANYRPFQNTNINLSADFGENVAVMAPNMLADQFATTDRTGTAALHTATQGGFTYVPATNTIFDTVGTRRSSGTNLVLFDGSIVPDKLNLQGPGAYNKTDHYAHSISIDQKIGDKLNIQLAGTLQEGIREIGIKGGASQAAVYRDLVATRADGSRNPYFNDYYTEFYHGIRNYPEPMVSVRASGVYDLKLRFMTQRIVGGLHHQSQEPLDAQYAEFVDPASPSFKGTLINANTLAAYQANVATLNQNRVFRRFYFKDGDDARFTERGAIPGRTKMLRDIAIDGAAGRLMNRYYWNTGGMIGSSGTYFKQRLHSMVGWRSDSFNQDPGRDFYNMVSGETYQLASAPNVRYRVRNNSYNFGGVVHITKFLAAYATYAENVVLTTTSGTPGFLPGSVVAAPKGFGNEYGLRWLFLDGRLESNWTYYETNRKASAAIPAAVGTNELAILFSDLNPAGADSQVVAADGLEFETIANLNRNWRLLWNFSSNRLATSERYPDLKAVHARAKAQNLPTPQTDAYLASIPDGTPVAGFTKIRSNLVTSYRFESGFLKGFNIGGGLQYRQESYQGNFDRDRNGTAEEIWTPGYTVGNLILGYRTRLMNRSVNIGMNINNVFDKHYYRASSLSTGAIGVGRDFRLSIRVNL